MEPSELLGLAATTLEALDIEYFATGSMASILYGEPRFTNDVDVVLRLNAADARRLCHAFPAADFYVSPDAARQAAEACSQFNVIHPGSGLKIDFMVAEASDFNDSRYQRSRRIEITPEIAVWFASPEDVILRKLEYYKAGGSDKHLRDIRGILRLCDEPIEHDYIAKWAARLGVMAEWELVRDE